MKYLAVALALLMVAGCTGPDGYERVDKSQPHELNFTTKRVDVWVASDLLVDATCGAEAVACKIDFNKHSSQIWVRKSFKHRKFALEHEFNHITYGPKHKGEKPNWDNKPEQLDSGTNQ